MTPTQFMTGLFAHAEPKESDRPVNRHPLVQVIAHRLASAGLIDIRSGTALKKASLVQRAYRRMLGPDRFQSWKSPKYLLAGVARRMHAIRIEHAFRRSRNLYGGDRRNLMRETEPCGSMVLIDRILAVDEVVHQLATTDQVSADIARLHLFGGLRLSDVTKALGLTRATIYRHWGFARAYLRVSLARETSSD